MNWDEKIQGYMTIEATLIFVTTLSTILFSISVGTYLYEKCVFELDTCYELQKSVQMGRANQEYIHLEDGVFRALRKKEFSFCLGIGQEKMLDFSVDMEVKKIEPSYVLRICQRIRGLEDERNRNCKQEIPESD